MGTFPYRITVRNPVTGQSAELDALVDTGATFTTIPSRILDRLGVQAVRTADAELADGSITTFPLGYAEVSVDGEPALSLCAFGAEGARALLGAITMESLLIAPDPVHRRFIKVRALSM